MSIEPIIRNVHRMSVHVEALAALGAALRLQRNNDEADPRVRDRLQEVLHALDPPLSEDCLGGRGNYATNLIETVFRQSTDLLQSPERAPGWRHEDPAILQSQGQVSRLIVHSIDELALQRADLRAALKESGVFLDVGTGAGWLALEAARVWPKLRIVGIDIWAPALALARKNVASSEYAERIELRSQHVEHLAEQTTYAVAWFPGSFIPAEITRQALQCIYRALVPGGWLIFALWAPSGDPLEAAVANLRIVRSGGHPWIATEVEDCLSAIGFVAIESMPPGVPGSPVSFVIAQRSR
jgi:SAM-dependent methyltransferase